MKVLVAHPGTQYSYHLVRELERRGFLYEFWTCFTISPSGVLGCVALLMPQSLRRKINNRILRDVPTKKIRTSILLELSALWRLKRGCDREEVFLWRNKNFQKRISNTAILNSDVIVGYDTSSWILVERCKALNRKFILDVSIPHPRTKFKVYQRILQDYPDWGFALQQKDQTLIDLEEKEMELATHIVVASTFSKNSLMENGVAVNKTSIIPYGVDSKAFSPLNVRKAQAPRFVFVGLVDARKGVPVLLDAWSGLDKGAASLTLIGPVSDEVREKIRKRDPSIHVMGSVSLDELKKLLPTFDSMIFPSYFEGFGLVILEAMSCGVMVITTEATCAPDVIEQNENGVIFQSGNSQELKNHIQHFLNEKEEMERYSSSARTKAFQYSWTVYGDRWVKTLKEL